MSHFVTVVILPEKGSLRELLAPYSEHLEVSEYDVTCDCVGYQMFKDVKAVIDKKRTTVSPKDLRAEEEKLTLLHPMRDTPDPNCEECGGSGRRKSTYNPQSKWDFWSIGGRWNDWIPGNESLVKNIDTPHPPFALVLPDGTWVQRGEMGWWATVTGEKDPDIWADEVARIYAQYPEYKAVAVDMHI